MLGLGLWLNRRKIAPAEDDGQEQIPVPAEILLLAIHLTLLFYVEFRGVAIIDALYDLGLIMGIIPMAAIVGAIS